MLLLLLLLLLLSSMPAFQHSGFSGLVGSGTHDPEPETSGAFNADSQTSR